MTIKAEDIVVIVTKDSGVFYVTKLTVCILFLCLIFMNDLSCSYNLMIGVY